jgi:DNA polymerase-3 subunit gamma/tau
MSMSLYRKYRPQTFEDMVGQEHIAQTLRNALSARPSRVAHAYLFCGPRGTGKTTSARLLAKALNCVNGPTATPCNECEFCARVRDNQPIMDLVELDGASQRKIENAREIIESISFAPSKPGLRKVYIIDEVHMFTKEAISALLKTIEEPPPHAVFILATTDAHKVPTTIVSRCQRFDFRRVGPSDIARRLHYVAQNENVALEEEAAQLIAQTADGGLRDALSLLEQVIAYAQDSVREEDVRLVLGSVSRELLWSMADAVAVRDAGAALRHVETAAEDGVSFGQLSRDLVAYARDALLFTVGFEDATGREEERKRLQEHARSIGRARLTSLIEGLRHAEKEMREGGDGRLLLELVLVRAAAEPEAAPASTSIAAGTSVVPVAQPVRPRVPAPAADEPLARPVLNGNGSVPVPSASPAPSLSLVRDEPPVSQAPPAPEAREENVTPEPEPEALEAAAVEATAVVEAGVEDEAPLPLPEEPVETSYDDAAQEEEAAREAQAREAQAREAQARQEAAQRAERAETRRKGRRIHNLQEFVELWPAVLVRVKKKIGVTAVAYLHDALPVEFNEKEAVLEFRKEFHFEKACEAAKRLPFEQVLNECLATPHVLKFRLAAPKPKAEIVEKAEEAPDDYEEEEDVFYLAKGMFAAQIVGRSGT